MAEELKVIEPVDERAMLDVEEKDEEKDEEVTEEETTEETDEKPDEEISEEDTEEKDEEVSEEDEDEETKSLEDDDVYQLLKKNHPKLLKEIPGLKTTIFREREYTSILPTIEDARTAASALDTLSGLENDLREGNSKNFISAIEELGEDSLNSFLSGFTKSLYDKSEKLHFAFIAPEVKRILRAASKHSDERISNAANNLHYWFFDNGNMNEEVGLKKPRKILEKKL
jgi:hypothetical protein